MPPAASKKGKRTAKAPKGRPARRVSLKFRIEPERAAAIQRIARAEGRTESDVLREGVDLVERVRARREHVPRLADFIKTIPPQYRERP